MKIVRTKKVLRNLLRSARLQGKTIGFVPTMGALHEGHLSLVGQARRDNDIVVVSVFINPLQFGPQEDFHKYPRDLKKDLKVLNGLCDIIFVPSSQEMYSRSFCSTVEVKTLSEHLCGKSRPGHFMGVATVVAKLFNITLPDSAYFGKKDAQQALVIQKMVEDLDFPVKINVMPIVREADGLAKSSRNRYLSKKERVEAVVLFQA